MATARLPTCATHVVSIAIVCSGFISCRKSEPPARVVPQTKFYRVSGPDYWGDYGAVLIQGYVGERPDGGLDVRRTGPFIPPITFPFASDGEIVVTDEFKKELEAAGISRLGFRKVVKKRIVDIPWRDWDLSTPLPEGLPDSELGDPDDLLDRPHSQQAADALGDLWQVILDDALVNQAEPPLRVGSKNQVWNGDAIFRDRDHQPVVTDRGKGWLEEHVGMWVRFHELKSE